MKTLHTIYTNFAKRNLARFLTVFTILFTIGIGQILGATASYTWDLTSSSANWTSSNCETYFSQPYGMKKKDAYIINKNIDDFKQYAATATSIQIGVKSLCNGATTSKLTIYLVDKDGNMVGSGMEITPDNKSSASNTTYKYVTFTSNLSTATGYKIQCTTFGKNVLVNGSSYEITYDDSSSGSGSGNIGGGNDSDGCTWELVTDASTLAAGNRIVIAAAGYDYAMGDNSSNGEYRIRTAITKNENKIAITNDVQIIILEEGTKTNTFAFNVDDSYLYAASSSSNHLKTKTTLDDNGSWSITIANNSVATIKAQGTNTRNWIRYNANSSQERFSCYGSGQNDVVIYKEICAKEVIVTLNPDGGTGTFTDWTTSGDNYTMTVDAGTEITLPTLQKIGYNFAGWHDGTATVTSPYTPTTDITLTAQWTAIEYTITYNDTKGATNTNPATYTIEDEITFSDLTNLPKGYNFTGWNPASIAKGTTGNQTVTAQWTEKPLTRYRTDCDACIPLDGFASIDGTYHFFPGETITMTVTPPADDVPYTYKWQKFVEDEWEDIDGKTTTTYTKAEATIEDVGHYRCVVSAEGYCDAIAEYNVKCLQLNVYYNDHSFAFTTPLEKVDATTASISVDLQNANYTYYFEITDGCENFYGFNGDIHSDWYENVELNAMNSSTHCGLQTTKFGTYIFTVDHSYLTDNSKFYPIVTVTYPASLQEANKVIYLDNNVLKWTHSNNADGTNKIYYRIGRGNHNNKTAMTLVPGTANLYKVTTSKYDNFDVWHIANNGCWSEDNSIFKTKTGDEWAATQATAFETLPVTLAAVTVTPTDLRSVGGDNDNNNCEFYNYNITEGMKTWNAKIVEPTNGTITVSYTHHDGTAVNNFTSGNRDLAHTCLLTITATANEGYSLASLTVNDVPFTSGNIHTLTGNAVIKATFTINSYTVTWKLDGGNWGGDASNKVVTHKFGDEIQAPEKPTYDCHEFVEWNPTYTAGMKMPANNLEFTAQWNKLSYTITFKDYDGTVLKTSTVECGETPTPPTSPTRGQDAMYEYEFAGWSPAITEVTGNQIYTATYNQTKRQYTVNWYVNGVQLHSELVAAGDEVTAPVVNPIPCGAVLAGWTDAENGVYEHEVSELHEGAQPSIVILENKTFYAVFADYVNE